MANTIKDLAASLKLIGEDALEKVLVELKNYYDAQEAKIDALEQRIATLEAGQ